MNLIKNTLLIAAALLATACEKTEVVYKIIPHVVNVERVHNKTFYVTNAVEDIADFNIIKNSVVIPKGFIIERSNKGRYRWVVNGRDSIWDFDTAQEAVDNWKRIHAREIESTTTTWEKVN